MPYQFRLREEPFEYYSESDNAEESLTNDFAETWEGEVSGENLDRYVLWMQQSLNKILKLGLKEDGQMGDKTLRAIQKFQRLRGLQLSTEGLVCPDTKTEQALITEATIPFPDIVEARLPETTPPGLTVYMDVPLQIPLGKAKSMTGIFIPENYCPTSKVDLIVYLHGWKLRGYQEKFSIDEYWSRGLCKFLLREEVNKSQKNVILVAPTLGPRNQAGSLTCPRGFDRFLAQVMKALKQYGPYAKTQITPTIGNIGNIILACHSGSGEVMRAIAMGTDTSATKIQECWAFEPASMGTTKDWENWAQSHPQAKLYIYYLPGNAGQVLCEGLARRKMPAKRCMVICKPNIFAELSLLAKSDEVHDNVPERHFRDRLEGAQFLVDKSKCQSSGTRQSVSPIRQIFRFQEFPFDLSNESGEVELWNNHWREEVQQEEVQRNRPDYIRWVQRSLNQIMGLRLAVDGDLGSQTRSAIRSFQQQQGLAVDGKAGPNTQGAIKAALSGSPAPTSPGGMGFLGTVPSFPAKPPSSTASPSPIPVPLFPPEPADPLITDAKMELALKNAIAKLEKDRKLTPGTFPVRFTIVDVTDPSGFFPSAGHLETVTDFIASEAKVAVMYSAYTLRDMVQRLASSSIGNMLFLPIVLHKQMNPAIIDAFDKIHPRSFLFDVYKVPSYHNVFAVKQGEEGGPRVTVNFTPAFDKALERMIVPSDNAAAAICVHGVGYGYLNGALAAGGFFHPSIDQGLWVAGDYGKGRQWPYERILSSNDGLVAQAGTTRDMAKLVSLIMTDRLLDPVSCSEMRGRLARTVSEDKPWIARTGIFKPGTITHNKLGLGPLKSGKNVLSEVSVYQSPGAKGRRYVVAWQNLVGTLPIGFADIAKIIKTTITEFER